MQRFNTSSVTVMFGQYGLKKLLLGKRFARVPGQAQQDFHHLGLEANGPSSGSNAVEAGSYDPASYSKVVHRGRPPAGWREL
jgi:hypothetical protein